MIACNLSAGDCAHTLGYASSGDNGEAYYNIVEGARSTEDNIFVIKLDNGLFAELKYDSSSIINVATLGIQTDAGISSIINKIMREYDGRFKGFQFNPGTYYLDKKVELRSFEFYGNNTELKVSDDFERSAKFIINSPSSTGILYDLVFKDLKFVYEVSETHTLKNESSVSLLLLSNINNCRFDHCDFVMKPADRNGTFMSGITLWFKYQIAGEVIINDCHFSNTLGKAWGNQTDFVEGGVLWFNGENPNSPFNSVEITNTTFEGCQSDELLAIWNGTFDNYKISSCSFTVNEHVSDNIVALYNGTFKRFCFSDCTFNANEGSKRLFKMMKLTGPFDVTIDHCNFNIAGTAGVAQDLAGVFFFLKTNTDGYAGRSSFRVNDCDISIADTLSYKSAINMTQSSDLDIEVDGCNINGKTSYGILRADSTNDISFICKNSILEATSMLMRIVGLTDSELTVQNNTITGNISSNFEQFATVGYEFSDNTCTVTEKSRIFYANCLDSSYAKSRLIIKDNNYDEDSLVSDFYSNKGLEQHQLIDRAE